MEGLLVWIALFFLALSLYLYCLLGGADFGAGVHELFVRRSQKRAHEDLVKSAIGPVWEANHMWLIIIVVILFVGFPRAYSELSIHLHVPLTLMLIGVILRGCAFSFRHYDSVEDGSRKIYSAVFSFSSLLTPIMFGVIIGAIMLGKIQAEPTDYYSTYIAPWANPFCLVVGLFVLSIFAFVAAIYMIGETGGEPFRVDYIGRAKIFHVLMIVMGAGVFALAHVSGLPFYHQFFNNPLAIGAFTLATLSHLALWRLFGVRAAWRLRLISGFQLLMVIVAWLAVISPNIIFYADQSTLSLLDAAAGPGTMTMLVTALVVGVLIFLPLLIYLFAVFKGSSKPMQAI